jgi:hypothetical protein
MSSELWTGVANAIELWAELRAERDRGKFACVPPDGLGYSARNAFKRLQSTYVEPRRWLAVMYLFPEPGSLMESVVRAMTATAGEAIELSAADVAELRSAMEITSELSAPPQQSVQDTNSVRARMWSAHVRHTGAFLQPPPDDYAIRTAFEFLGAWLRERIFAGSVTSGEALEIAGCFPTSGALGDARATNVAISLSGTTKTARKLGDVWRELASCIAGEAGSDAAGTRNLMRAGLGKDISEEAGRALLHVARAWHGGYADVHRVGALSDWTLLLLRLADYRPHHRQFERDGELVASTIEWLRERLQDGKMSVAEVNEFSKDLSRRWSYRQLFEETHLLRSGRGLASRGRAARRRRGEKAIR